MSNKWEGKKVFITGVCGTVGKEVLFHLLDIKDIKITGVDNNESELFFLKDRIRKNKNISLYYCDIRDSKELKRLAKKTDYIIHTAALKHVDICEVSPFDAVKTNVLGTQAIIDLAEDVKCERVLFTSTDKAVNPTNVMGTSKLLAERLMSSANQRNKGSSPIYFSTRFGNVLGSRGSVIPLFKKQIKSGGPVTITDGSMTRFIMSLSEATSLVLNSMFIGKGGEVFVTKMPVMKIMDLAEIMIEVLAPRFNFDKNDIEIETIGKRPGEKTFEELTNEEEIRRTIELKNYLCIVPTSFSKPLEKLNETYNDIVRFEIDKPYNSSTQSCLSKKMLKDYILSKNII